MVYLPRIELGTLRKNRIGRLGRPNRCSATLKMQGSGAYQPEFANFFEKKIAFAISTFQGRRPLVEKVRDVASALIDSTVRVIARDGLDKASVRTISSDCQVPNPYIYQFFKDKDDLLISAFTREDTKFADEFSRFFSSVHSLIQDTESRCRVIWFRLWKYMMEHQESIQFYVRYYYSTYYEQYSQAEHQERFQPLAEAVQNCFVETANTQALLQHILDNMMNLAMKVYSGELPDNDEARQHYFTLTLAAVAPYMKKGSRETA